MIEVITKNLDLWTSALIGKAEGARGGNGKAETYGIKKLRELILGSALRGLFERDNKSLPESIEQDIANARDAYYEAIGKKAKEYGFGRPLLAEYKLPVGWKWKRVGDLCDLQTGATPSTHKPEYFGGDIRWLVSGDINQGIIEDCEGRITQKGLENSNCKVLPSQTVLIALNGQGKTRASVALLKVAAACNQSLVGMIPFDAAILDPMFLLLSLRYRYYEIRDITGQDQRRGLNMGLVAELSIPLPPLVEQHRIVAKVDELMAVCDQLEQQQTHSIEAHKTLVETLLATLTRATSPQELTEAWGRIASHFDTLFATEYSVGHLKQTILQLAVMGRLVPQDANDEPAIVLLQKMVQEKARLSAEGEIREPKELKKRIPHVGNHELPAGWKWSHLGEFSYVQMGNSPPGSSYNEDGEGVPLINGPVEFSEGPFGLTKKIKFTTAPTYMCKKGDILVCVRGATTGRTNIASADSCIGRGVALVRAWESQAYINLFMWHIGNELLEAGKGTTFPSISYSDLATWPVPIPPLKEQRRIVGKVEQLVGLCDAVVLRLAEAQNTQAHLAAGVVERALA